MSTHPFSRAMTGLALLSTLGLGSSCNASPGFFARARKPAEGGSVSTTARHSSITIQNDSADGPVSAYAFVHQEGGDCLHINAHSDYLQDLRALKAKLGKDFLWFRLEGQAYVVKDPALLAKAWDLFKPAEALEAQEAGLEREEQQLEERHDRLESQQEALEAKSEALDEEEERLDDDEEVSHAAERARIAAKRAPLAKEREALGRQMEALEREMENLQRRQEALSGQEEKASRDAERALQQLMQEAVTRGTAAKLDGR